MAIGLAFRCATSVHQMPLLALRVALVLFAQALLRAASGCGERISQSGTQIALQQAHREARRVRRVMTVAFIGQVLSRKPRNEAAGAGLVERGSARPCVRSACSSVAFRPVTLIRKCSISTGIASAIQPCGRGQREHRVGDPDEPLEEVVGMARVAPQAHIAHAALVGGVALECGELRIRDALTDDARSTNSARPRARAAAAAASRLNDAISSGSVRNAFSSAWNSKKPRNFRLRLPLPPQSLRSCMIAAFLGLADDALREMPAEPQAVRRRTSPQ